MWERKFSMAACQEKNGFNSFPFVLLLPPSSADWQSPGGKMNISFFFFLCLFLYLSFFSLLFFLWLSRLAIPRWKNYHFFLFLSMSLLIYFFLFSTFLSLSLQIGKSPGGKIIMSYFFARCPVFYLLYFFFLLLSWGKNYHFFLGFFFKSFLIIFGVLFLSAAQQIDIPQF